MQISPVRLRLFRFLGWALAMIATSYIVSIYSPHRVVFVPCFFLMIMAPAVLLPLHPKRKG